MLLRNTLRLLVAGCLAFLGCFASRASEEWHHAPSPWRAVFQANDLSQEGGLLLEVPICDLAPQDGGDVICFDDQGRQLLSMPRGRGMKNTAILQVRPREKSHIVYAYFGSHISAPKADLPPAPLCEFFAFPNGRTSDSWNQTTDKLIAAKSLGCLPMRTFPVCGNHADRSDQFAIRITAQLKCPRDCYRALFLCADGAAALFLDGKQVYAQTGEDSVWANARGEKHEQTLLREGNHDLTILGVNYRDVFRLALGEYFMPPRVAYLPESDFIQAAGTTIQRVESKERSVRCPAFTYEIREYSDLPNNRGKLDVVYLRSWSSKDLVWEFDDGVTLKGKEITRPFTTLETRRVKVHANYHTAGGTIAFPSAVTPPRQLSPNNPAHLREIFRSLDTVVSQLKELQELHAALQFYLLEDFHPGQAIAAERYLRFHPDRSSRHLLPITLAYARSSENSQPEEALLAWLDALSLVKYNPPYQLSLLEECLDFLLYRVDNPVLARKTLLKFPKLTQAYPLAARLMQYDIEEWENNRPACQDLQRQILACPPDDIPPQKDTGENAEFAKTAAAQANAIRMRLPEFRRTRSLLTAENSLRQWRRLLPEDRFNGAYLLEKARLLAARDRRKAAVRLLQQAMEGKEILPYLPDLEYELALQLEADGKKAEARKIRENIARDYPHFRPSP